MNTNGVEMLLSAMIAGAASLIVFIYALKLVLNFLKIASPVRAPRPARISSRITGRKIEPLSTRVHPV